jgi:hypothetical protein
VPAVHDKTASDRAFKELLPLVERGAKDDRNFVKKAVNWALRNIGKRNRVLNAAAVACAKRILAAANKRAGGERGGDPSARAARWVANDANLSVSRSSTGARDIHPGALRRTEVWPSRTAGATVPA